VGVLRSGVCAFVASLAILGLGGTAHAAGYTLTVLGDLPRGGHSIATSINSTGQVVGRDQSRTNAFLWNAAGGMLNLGYLPGGESQSRAFGINNNGQVVGQSGRFVVGRAFIWDAVGGMQDLGVLPGDNFSFASGINDVGQISGTSSLNTGNKKAHAFLWDAVGGMQDLGVLPGGDSSNASGINNAGQVVGAGNRAGTGNRAFLWDVVNGMQDLNDLIDPALSVLLEYASDINSSGQIVGYGNISGYRQAFLLTPCDNNDNCVSSIPSPLPPGSIPTSVVPIPATFLLILSGIGAMGGIAWHRKAAMPQA
jgi:probable HAF family extracellular repeat protein